MPYSVSRQRIDANLITETNLLLITKIIVYHHFDFNRFCTRCYRNTVKKLIWVENILSKYSYLEQFFSGFYGDRDSGNVFLNYLNDY